MASDIFWQAKSGIRFHEARWKLGNIIFKMEVKTGHYQHGTWSGVWPNFAPTKIKKRKLVFAFIRKSINKYYQHGISISLIGKFTKVLSIEIYSVVRPTFEKVGQNSHIRPIDLCKTCVRISNFWKSWSKLSAPTFLTGFPRISNFWKSWSKLSESIFLTV
jgi:hypothetical protein